MTRTSGKSWTEEENELLLSLIHTSRPGGHCTTLYTWKEIADLMNQSGISSRVYTRSKVNQHYDRHLWPQAQAFIERFQAEVQQQIEDAGQTG